MPGLVKIGYSELFSGRRIKDHNGTSVPGPFNLFHSRECADAYNCEQRILNALSAFRLSKEREFFEMPARVAKKVVDAIIDGDTPKLFARLHEPDDKEPTVTAASQLGRFLMNERRRRGLTQEEVAAATGLSRVSIGQIERGKPSTRLSSIFKIVRVLGTSVAIT